jgi:hypothetical protein
VKLIQIRGTILLITVYWGESAHMWRNKVVKNCYFAQQQKTIVSSTSLVSTPKKLKKSNLNKKNNQTLCENSCKIVKYDRL